MPPDWSSVAVSDVLAKGRNALAIGPFGSRMKAECYVPTGVPVIRGTNITDTTALAGEFVFVSNEKATELSSAIVCDGDLVFPHRGLIGTVGIVTGGPSARYILSTSLMKFTPDPMRADPTFLFYYFRSPRGRHELLKNASQVGTPGIATPLASLRSLQITLPSLEEQQAIVHILASLDGKIDLNRRMNETLEAIAARLFKSWFVDFKPVRVGADDCAPPDLAATFPRRLDETDFGELPMGWRFAAVSEVAEVNSWTLSVRDPLERVDYIEISEVKFGDVDKVVRYDRGSEPGRARRRLRHGDTVLSTVRPDRGSYFLCLDPSPYLVASTGFAVVTPRSVPWSFLHVALTRPEFITHLGRLADGAAYPSVSPDVIAAWQVPIPDDERILNTFHEVCGPLFDLAHNNRKEAQTLRTLRDTLLPKLLSGEVRVRETESLIEAAV